MVSIYFRVFPGDTDKIGSQGKCKDIKEGHKRTGLCIVVESDQGITERVYKSSERPAR